MAVSARTALQPPQSHQVRAHLPCCFRRHSELPLTCALDGVRISVILSCVLHSVEGFWGCQVPECVSVSYCLVFCALLRDSAGVRCRKGFLPEEGLEDICSLLRHGFSRLVIVCGSATCDYLLSCVEEWKCSEQRWRRPKRQHMTPRSSTQQELPLALARRVRRSCRTQSCDATHVADLCNCTDRLSLPSHPCCDDFMSNSAVSGFAVLGNRSLSGRHGSSKSSTCYAAQTLPALSQNHGTHAQRFCFSDFIKALGLLQMQKPQGLGRWLSCIIGVPESSCGRPNLNGRVTPDGGRDLSSDSSDSDSSDESEADPFEEREDAYVPAVEAVSAQQHKVVLPPWSIGTAGPPELAQPPGVASKLHMTCTAYFILSGSHG